MIFGEPNAGKSSLLNRLLGLIARLSAPSRERRGISSKRWRQSGPTACG